MNRLIRLKPPARVFFPLPGGNRWSRPPKSGWKSTPVKQVVRQAAERLHLTFKTVTQLVQANTREAIRTAAENGLARVGQAIPFPPETDGSSEPPNGFDSASDSDDPLYLRSNPLVQLQILGDISNWIYERRTDYSVFFSLVMEGLYRGVGLDRVFFSLLTPDRSCLQVKYHLGWRRPEQGVFKPLDSIPITENIFSYVLEQKIPFWVKPDPEPFIEQIITTDIHPITDRGPFFMMPMVVWNKSIGLIYADRHPSGREINQEKFLSFQQFCQLAAIGMSMITQRDAGAG